MKQDYQIWNILHDGALVEMHGEVPGEIEIKVAIAYLANQLECGFDNILVTLKNCTHFEYERYWTKDKTQTFRSIKELEGISPSLMALSCEEEGDYLLIVDICGTIKTSYSSAELALENGVSLSFKELDHVSKKYWDNFGAKSST